MSWIKRRGLNTPSPAPAPPVQMYNPNQHSTQENQWQNQQMHDNWYSQPQQQQPQQPYQPIPKQEPQTHAQQQNYWQQPYNPTQPTYQNPPQPSQQYQYQNQQPGYYQNSTAGYEQPAHGNFQYTQQYNQNNLYGNQAQGGGGQGDGGQNEGDAWNWGWGDEDNLNVRPAQQPPQQGEVDSTQTGNSIGGAFTNDETWNWGAEDTKTNVTPVQNVPKKEPAEVEDPFPKPGQVQIKTVKSENEADTGKPVLQDHLTVTGRRGKLETPQWSTESQVSQESSDDILHTSESDKSHMMSRSSTISHSPILGQDPPSLPNLDDIPPLKNEPSFDDLASNHQFENKEILSNIKQEPADAWPAKTNPTPPPPKNTQTPPLNPPPGGTDDLKNPYKRGTGLSHKATGKYRASSATDGRQSLYQPGFHNQQVNLETLPDNSEQPDQPVNHLAPKIKPVPQWPDNNEAPINDRNQYLETGQLSEINLPDYNHSDASLKQDMNDTLPPPGLRRMVPGQLEQNESTVNAPPPGLSRMVLGQTESVTSIQSGVLPVDEDIRLQYETTGPPEGLHRMIPGESSSPESTLRHQQPRREENDSEAEFDRLTQHAPQPRSATIGADTPPAVTNPNIGANRSETIGGGDGNGGLEGRARGHMPSNSASSSASDNARHQDKTVRGKPPTKPDSLDVSRRDSIEGQTQENELSTLTTSIRNLTVGENLTDGQLSNASLPEPPPSRRRGSRQESSDSDRELKKLPGRRDKREKERGKLRDKEREKGRDGHRERYSPEVYKDGKKHDRRRYKDRRYEEDTDYYSDKEKERRTRDDRDYDRKYASLRKDKERERRRRGEPREYRRSDYYYNNTRYEDEYENERGSRPSSRSDSMHESFRERGHEKDPRDRRQRDRERERYRRHRDQRDMFNPYQGVAYDPYNPYYQQYQYYENLRRTNPQAYAEWYRKYYQQAAGQASSFGGEDRASVHSGRSSANDEMAKDSLSRPFDQTDASLNYDDSNMAAQRLTPAKFATAHVKASIASGKLLRVLPHYPMDGQNATVEVCSLPALLANDEEYKELSRFPGPLVKGVTHKKTIIEYCENKIRDAAFNREIEDAESYVLMWELLILLIRQNGMVVGTDIAELLLKNRNEQPLPRPSSVISSISSNVGDPNPTSETSNQGVSEHTGSLHSVLKEEEITNKFREFLLYGSGKEALEWAMKHGLWGHALFLASKLDKRTYANVMMRFANGLTLNDPLQTLYQLLSGKMPAAVTCVSDEKWGDWRPHVAMILSNSTQRPELNCKAITTLGDTLRNRGSLYAAQFCYLMAEVGFGKHDNPETRLALLGADHTKTFPLFASNEAMHMTEIYEYACGLNDADFIIPEFQIYKYLLATRLADRGLLEKSLLYLERLSGYIVGNPSAVQAGFVDKVFQLADRLKFYDPVGEVEDESEFGGILETNRPDNSWLKDLIAVQRDYQAGLITHESINNLAPYVNNTMEAEMSLPSFDTSPPEQSWQQQYDQQYQTQQTQWQPEQQQQLPAQQDYGQQEGQQSQQLQNDYSSGQYQTQQNYWPGQQPQWGDPSLSQFSQEGGDQQQSFYGSNNAQIEPKEVQKDSPEDVPQPQISMPNRSVQTSYNDEPQTKQDSPEKKPSPVKGKAQSPLQEKTQSTGWFGGIFSKLALKPKNQMKLPDDKNPKIVWDQDKKKWTNVDEDPSDPASEFKPPPKMADFMPKMPLAPQQPAGIANNFVVANSVQQVNQPMSYDLGKPASADLQMATPGVAQNAGGMVDNGQEGDGNAVRSSQQNMFKLKRGRNLKNSYIDVFNPGGKPSGPTSLPPADKFPSSSAAQMNFFIPQAVADQNAPIDFLTPGGAPHLGEQQKKKTNKS